MRILINKLFVALAVFCLLTTAIQAQVYTLEQRAMAGGGMSNGAGGSYDLSSTTGQAAAGNSLRGDPGFMEITIIRNAGDKASEVVLQLNRQETWRAKKVK